MEKTLKIEQVYALNSALEMLDKVENLGVKHVYRIGRLKTKCERVMKEAEKAREKLVGKFTVETESTNTEEGTVARKFVGKTDKQKEASKDKFNSEFKELMAQEETGFVLPDLSLEDLEWSEKDKEGNEVTKTVSSNFFALTEDIFDFSE